MSDVSPHEWLRPRLSVLVAEAAKAGIAHDVSVAVITDLINGPLSAPEPAPTGENPNQDLGEPDTMANEHSGAHPSLPAEPTGGIGLGSHLSGHVGRRHPW